MSKTLCVRLSDYDERNLKEIKEKARKFHELNFGLAKEYTDSEIIRMALGRMAHEDDHE